MLHQVAWIEACSGACRAAAGNAGKLGAWTRGRASGAVRRRGGPDERPFGRSVPLAATGD